MKKLMLVMALAASLLAACAGGADEPTLEAEVNTVEPAVTQEPDVGAEPAPSPTSAVPTPAFQARTYLNEDFGFAFDYPASWSSPEEAGESARGNIVQFNEGAQPLLTVSILDWDPAGNLAAYSESRETGWLNSEFTILEEEQLRLADGTPAQRYILLSPDGEQALFLLTELEDRYLILSGAGEIDLLHQVSATLRLMANES